MRTKPVNDKPSGNATALKLLAAASLFLLPACASPQSNDTAAEEANVTSEELVDDTASYVGEEITIRAEVEDTVDETAFLMADDDYFDGEGILVINASSEPFVVPDVGETEVQVTGQVETFAMTAVSTEYGLTLDADLYSEYEDQPVIIAESIALAPDPGEITENPEIYYNKRIAVEGEVEDILESGLFTMDEEELFGGDDLLVIPGDLVSPVKDGEFVTATGVLRPYITAEFERDYDLQWDLSVKETIEAEYETKPVFVADTVYPSAVPE
ncbi:hypothetical protein S7335_2045 [Synechococcus sp. PCC 7335]|uniref:hypothetical protein n=1 Tax=Synechococcus sp. (strain ATCC 29403 / PCC 7335) TaxID=91464 RepID=UPI00017ED1AC|nr:hypothetical protein [Synechococcus sp. PCC 7335]EDX84348.1 hypothetical protein S7335_2045 [Synechococcus sp. PCC 7335]